MPTTNVETAVNEDCIFVIFKDGTSIPAKPFVEDLGIPKTWAASTGWKGKTIRVMHAFNGMLQSAASSRDRGKMPSIHFHV